MKTLLILGAGTAGTIVANRMSRSLSRDWRVAVVDPAPEHLYQPGLLFLPFGARDEAKDLRRRERTLDSAVEWIKGAVKHVDPAQKTVDLEDGTTLAYDLLVIATGTRIRPDLTEGLVEDGGYPPGVHDFYTLEGAKRLREALATFQSGRLVVNVVEMPIKCPVAPLEFLFLADDFFRKRGIREKVEIVYATPLDAAFTKPLAAQRLGYLLKDKGITLETEFSTGGVDGQARKLRSWDEREVGYDLLVTVPTHSGAAAIEASGLGNELAFIPTDKHTLAAKGLESVFVLGDATDLPSSKAGSVAHFQADGLVENLHRVIAGQSPEPLFDGHANCFVETGRGRAMLIDFNYDVEPLPGKYPVAGVGPFDLLKESRTNHLGKLGFRWLYWNALLPGRPVPVPAQMSMAGKVKPPAPVADVANG